MALFDRHEPLNTGMMTPVFINEATREITNARNSVEAGKGGSPYVPTVRRVCRELGNVTMESYIIAQLVSLNIVLNLARPMSEAMMEQSAPMIVRHILEDDCDVNLADLRIIFDRAKTGQYGEFYNGIGLADVCGWIDAYICEKCAEYERWHQNTYKQPRL